MSDRTQRDIARKCDAIKNLLIEKNRKYGDSALEPVRTFSQSSAVEQILVRIDDKLSRIARGSGLLGDDEDVIQDLIGYLVLLQIAIERRDEKSITDAAEHYDAQMQQTDEHPPGVIDSPIPPEASPEELTMLPRKDWPKLYRPASKPKAQEQEVLVDNSDSDAAALFFGAGDTVDIGEPEKGSLDFLAAGDTVEATESGPAHPMFDDGTPSQPQPPAQPGQLSDKGGWFSNQFG